MIIKIKKAFTLAEVLITLGVIGAVAALTLPNLIADYKKQVTVTQLKKAKSVFEQGIKKRMADIDCTDLNCGGITEFLDPNRFEVEARKTFEIMSACSQSAECMPKDKNGQILKYKTLGGVDNVQINKFGIFITKDGAMYGLQDPFCANVNKQGTAGYDYNCAFVMIDVNGPKLPNQWGKDAFYFILGENGILFPAYGEQWSLADNGTTNGTWRNHDYCTGLSSASSGLGCAARIMESGWKIDY